MNNYDRFRDYFEPNVKACIAKAKELGFDIFVLTKINKRQSFVSCIKEHDLIRVTPGEHPGSWTVI